MVKDVKVDPMNTTFAKVMEVMTYLGLIMMIVPGTLYLITKNGLVSTKVAVKYWDKPAKVFWVTTKGIKIGGYSWFLSNLHYMDCLSVVGIVLLALAPLVAIIAAITKADSKYRILLAVLIVEFTIAIVRPLFMHVTGH